MSWIRKFSWGFLALMIPFSAAHAGDAQITDLRHLCNYLYETPAITGTPFSHHLTGDNCRQVSQLQTCANQATIVSCSGSTALTCLLNPGDKTVLSNLFTKFSSNEVPTQFLKYCNTLPVSPSSP
ncbi:MAG: hypothetical protein ACOYKZ_01800 [Chlamydiia bacterium]